MGDGGVVVSAINLAMCIPEYRDETSEGAHIWLLCSQLYEHPLRTLFIECYLEMFPFVGVDFLLQNNNTSTGPHHLKID